MSKVCSKCGYELFPLDTVCDNCGQEVSKENDSRDSETLNKTTGKKTNSKESKVFASDKKTPKTQKSEKTDKAIKTSKVDKAAKATNAAKPEKTDKGLKTPKSEKPTANSNSDNSKILIIIGCVLGGLVLGAIITFAIIYALKSGGEFGRDDSYAEEDFVDDYSDPGIYDSSEYPDEVLYDEAMTEDNSENQEMPIIEDIPIDEAAPEEAEENQEEAVVEQTEEVIEENDEASPDEADEMYIEEDETIEGSENIGKTFNIGEEVNYDGIVYRISSFNEYSDPEENFGEPDEGCKWYEITFDVVNKSEEEKDVDIYGTYLESGVETYTYTSFEKDSYATLSPGASANLAVIIGRADSASSGEYRLDIGYYYGEAITFRLY